ncbi:MAG: S41 family peptidase [Kiloniellales bacterium]|nr:S41 family peptidase [Kiloniellales bacterium]
MFLTACAAEQVEDPLGYDRARASRLFSDGYQHISEIYIEELAMADLAQAGMDSLTELDSELSLAADGGAINLSYRDHLVSRLPVPKRNNADDWGALTAQAVESSRGVSPAMADVEAERLYEVVFDGIVTRLDRFSRYAGRETARENRASRDGFGGIGVRIRVVDEGVKILSIMEKTPAEESGLQVEDVITDIDGVSAVGLSQREVVRRLRGPIRSKVKLLVERETEQDKLPILVTRALVVPQTVEYRADDNIGYLRVSNFNQGTARSLREKLELARRELGDDLLGFVLDLRGNPGGLLDQGVEVADLFVREGHILTTHGRHPDSHQVFDAASDDLADGLPVVVLLDGSSASASEIVAAALQDAERAVLVGSNSFGKGTVQTVLRLPNEGELTLTWATFHAPSGYGLNALGVMPNLCTSGDVTSAADVLARLDRGEFPLQHYASDIVSSSDDPAQLAVLRARCPKRDGEPEIDLEVAEALLRDLSLYDRALGTAPETAAVRQEAQSQDDEAACPSDSLMQPASC